MLMMGVVVVVVAFVAVVVDVTVSGRR